MTKSPHPSSEDKGELLPVTVEAHVKISAEDMANGLCSMTCPQCLAIPSTNGLCPLCSDSGWVIRTVEEAAKMRVFLRWEQIDKRTKSDTGDEAEDSFHIGVSDGFQEAVQIIDTLTGGDGEYRYAMNGDPERHCPTPVEMIANIVERFQTHSLPGDVGMQIVPVEPTEAMYLAAFNSSPWDGSGPIRRVVDEVWSAMLLAARKDTP